MGIKDIIQQKDISKTEILLKRKLAFSKHKRCNYDLQELNFIEAANGIALIKEGIIFYFYPDAIGYDWEGQYNIIIPYKRLKENNINLKIE